MSLDIPDPLLQLEANCGVFAVWLILKQYQSNIDIAELIQLCRHDYNEGTFPDPDIDEIEKKIYLEAKQLQILIRPALTYEKIQQAYEDGKFVIVFYDTLDGAGNQSLIYSIDEQEISFCDHFEVMSKAVFEQQYQADEICQQAIVVEQPLNFYPI
ncbi:MAG: peptidase C39 [Acinetobacter sp. GWC1_38_13]|uniref:cysteine peptidase family C39 domain-containing protein n=1 Tax=Acinetobacter sp. GWC1_38_13 TaxID=1797234 RepID=UPI0008BA6A79|nr:cysteine peptidase family C39 domain-containing protein [Acinetobacter sp. GWC1_38_13]OFW46513.1 MAG: peptidase C39 [Acinetobacter sp. GWC1_38_13]